MSRHQKHAPPGLLRSLGIHGWDRIEPVILAALATEAPLLLIGPHGSAKTLVLTKLAAALGLEHRHYNASLLNFDDLVGFPVPQDGRLVYLQTPSTIWDAESVLFDEVSRCRPELQNKLFPIVHEKIVQGVPLTRLRHRWGAMNPPPAIDAADESQQYAGAEPLDVALADRFAFIVRVPALADLTRHDQLALLRASATVPDEAGSRAIAEATAAAALQDAITRIQQTIATMPANVRDASAEYAQIVSQRLASAGHPLSTRRAVQLTRNIVALAATLNGDLEDAFFNALRYSVPDEAWGAPVPHATVLTVHRAAWELAKLDGNAALKALLTEPDPVRRIALAVAAPPSAISRSQAGQVLADTWSSLPRLDRLATAAALTERFSLIQGLPTACVELVAGECARLGRQGTEQITVRNGGADWRRTLLGSDLARLSLTSERGKALTNAAVVLMQEGEPFELTALETAYDHASDAFKAAGS